MIAAIYARKSNEQTGIADESKSVTRQIEHATAYARKRGLTVSDAHIYVDDGISGAEFAKRPGFLRLMNALKPKPPFNAVIISELSRLGREQLETGYAVKQLSQAGVKIFSYLEDKEIALDTPTDKFLMSAVSFAAEIEREKGRQRVSDAMIRKARLGHCCGGRTFGYDNVDVTTGIDASGRPIRSHVERKINANEAAVVRRIFHLCASGKGIKSITKALNVERAVSPRPQQGRPASWAPSSVRSVLYRGLYRGLSTWNRTKQSDTWGQRSWAERPESDWVKVDAPHLQIVTVEQWNAAHKRLQSAQATYLRSSNGRVWGRPPTGIESKYLLSGMNRCACCGQSLTVRSSSHGKKRFFYFVCSSFDHRGATVCANNLRLPMDAANDEILTKLSEFVLDPEVIEGAIEDAIGALRPSRRSVETKRTALLAKIRKIEQEQGRYAAGIAAAGNIDVLVDRLKDCEADRARFRDELALLDGIAQVSTFDVGRIEQSLRARVAEWRALLHRQTPLARQMVARILDGEKITWTPRPEQGRYDYSGRASLDRLLSGLVSTQGGTSPTGFEPVF